MNAIVQVGNWLPQKQERHLPPHTDPGLEIIYLAKGEVAWDYSGQPIEVQSPAVSFTLPWQEHCSATPRVPSCELYWVLIKLDKEYAAEPNTFGLDQDLHLSPEEQARIIRAIYQAPYPVVSAENLLAHLIPELVSEYQSDRDTMRLRSLVNLTLTELAIAIENQTQAAPPPTARQRVRAFMSELGTGCAQPWTLEDMAASCGLGRTQFTEHLRALTGDSPVQLLNRLRVDKACRLLQRSDQDITEIAFACGFNTSQYFARVFRDYTGISATLWRARSRKSSNKKHV